MASPSLTKTAPAVRSPAAQKPKGERTRDRILDFAYDSVIRKGFAATSIEELVEAAGITKSGFFYHFKDKTDLARQLIARYTSENASFLDDMAERARELSDDPLHSFLIFLKLCLDFIKQRLLLNLHKRSTRFCPFLTNTIQQFFLSL